MIPTSARDYDNYGYRYGNSYGYSRKYGRKYGQEYGDSELVSHAKVEAQLAPYSPSADELLKLEIESYLGTLEAESASKPNRRKKVAAKPAAKKKAVAKKAPAKSRKKAVKKGSPTTKRTPRKP